MRVKGHAMPLLSDRGTPGVGNKPTVLYICDGGGVPLKRRTQDGGPLAYI